MKKCKAIIHDICPATQLSNLAQMNAYCCVSLSNPNYFGKRLDTVVKFLVANFHSTLIVTSGFIYRKHFALFNDGDVQKSLEIATEFENRYINEELLPILSQHKQFNVEFTKWSELYVQPYYKKCHEAITNLYRDNATFKNSINQTAKSFVEKQMTVSDKIKIDKDHCMKLSIDFLLEEISMIDLLVEKGYQVEVYPGMHVPALKKMILGEIDDAPINLKNRTSIEIKIQKIGNKTKEEVRGHVS